MRYSERDEWLEADGLGGFASGTAAGIRTRRYHALLLTATTPPTGRMVLVNGFDAWFENAAGAAALTSLRYDPGVVHPDGATRIMEFSVDPWPRWTFSLADGTTIEHAIVARHGVPVVALSWRVLNGSRGTLSVRPFFSGRDYHSLHRENGAFRFAPESTATGGLVWRPYDGVPSVHFATSGEYHHRPDWYWNFRYEAERDRGLDYIEDLAAPGTFNFSLDRCDAALIFCTEPLAETDARRRAHGDSIGRVETAHVVCLASPPSG
jgi:predicted glycogen debranching enzyme